MITSLKTLSDVDRLISYFTHASIADNDLKEIYRFRKSHTDYDIYQIIAIGYGYLIKNAHLFVDKKGSIIKLFIEHIDNTGVGRKYFQSSIFDNKLRISYRDESESLPNDFFYQYDDADNLLRYHDNRGNWFDYKFLNYSPHFPSYQDTIKEGIELTTLGNYKKKSTKHYYTTDENMVGLISKKAVKSELMFNLLMNINEKKNKKKGI